MTPRSSRRLTRSDIAGRERPTLRPSSDSAMRPSSCSASMMARSLPSRPPLTRMVADYPRLQFIGEYRQLPMICHATGCRQLPFSADSRGAAAMRLIGMMDSPYVRRVAVSLKCLGLPLVHEPVSVFRHYDRFAAINPVVKAPTLVTDDSVVLMESTLILEHAERLV